MEIEIRCKERKTIIKNGVLDKIETKCILERKPIINISNSKRLETES